MTEEVTASPNWYVIQTKPRQGLRAETNLKNQDYTVFYPQMTVERVRRGHLLRQFQIGSHGCPRFYATALARQVDGHLVADIYLVESSTPRRNRKQLGQVFQSARFTRQTPLLG